MPKELIARIRQYFLLLIGTTLACYESAEILIVDGDWEPWPDLPLRLINDAGSLVAVSWSEFDSLWLADDRSLPFEAEDSTTRWVINSLTPINVVLGGLIKSVRLGRGEMSIEGREIEIWTRLFIEVGDQWLEIFNALDENGYAVHSSLPQSDTHLCV